jgi:hypothetical protein
LHSFGRVFGNAEQSRNTTERTGIAH